MFSAPFPAHSLLLELKATCSSLLVGETLTGNIKPFMFPSLSTLAREYLSPEGLYLTAAQKFSFPSKVFTYLLSKSVSLPSGVSNDTAVAPPPFWEAGILYAFRGWTFRSYILSESNMLKKSCCVSCIFPSASNALRISDRFSGDTLIRILPSVT